jgi:hypothetical protein
MAKLSIKGLRCGMIRLLTVGEHNSRLTRSALAVAVPAMQRDLAIASEPLACQLEVTCP